MINLLKYDRPYELLLDVQGYDAVYAVYGDAEDYVEQTSEWVRQFAKSFHREYVPAFVLQIDNEAMLEQALEEFFYVAEQNLFFALTNEPCLVYKGYHATTTSETVEILLADYDGKAVIFLTNSKEDLYAKND